MIALLLIGASLAGPTPPSLSAQAEALQAEAEARALDLAGSQALSARWSALLEEEGAALSADRPAWERRRVRLLAKSCQPMEAAALAGAFDEALAPGGAWLADNPATEVQERALVELEKTLRYAAVELQRLSRAASGELPPLCADEAATESPSQAALQASSSALYARWFDRFADTANAQTMRYAYGELRYAMADLEGAYAQQMQAVALDTHPDQSATSAELAVHIAKEALEVEAWEGEGQSPWGQRLVDAAERYVVDPQEPKQWRVLLHVSYVSVFNGATGTALTFGLDAVEAHPEADESWILVDLLLDKLLLSEDYAGLGRFAQQLLALSGLPPDQRAYLSEIRVRAALAEAERALAGGEDPGLLAQRLEAVYRAHAQASGAHLAGERAVELYQLAGDRRAARRLKRALP